MDEHTCERLADRADAILLRLLTAKQLSGHEEQLSAECKGLEDDLNAQLREEFPDVVEVYVRVAAASPVPSQRVFVRILLEMIVHGINAAVWTVDYDGAGHLHRVAPGFIRGQRVEPDEEE